MRCHHRRVRSRTILMALFVSAWAVAIVPAASGLVGEGAATLLFVSESGPNPESLELQLQAINSDGTGARTLLRGLPDGVGPINSSARFGGSG